MDAHSCFRVFRGRKGLHGTRVLPTPRVNRRNFLITCRRARYHGAARRYGELARVGENLRAPVRVGVPSGARARETISPLTEPTPCRGLMENILFFARDLSF